MKPDIIHDTDDTRFYADLEGDEAELTYAYLEDDLLDFDYTYVPEAYRNQGIADELIKTGLEFVKSNNFKFVPSCPAVSVYLKRHPEYNAFVDESR